jgi:CRISPR/Cas system endoribonuclease Cas6 (RAMP superfamily)
MIKPPMLYGEYHFRAVLSDRAILPPYKGSTFRGVFGRALRSVTCALKREDCAICLLNRQCVYAKVFDSHTGRPGRGRPSPPHPFVIEPPLSGQTEFEPGESFDFSLLLFGQANQYLPYFVYAFEQMGQIGIGRQIFGKRACFQLSEVTGPTGTTIYQSQEQELKADEAVNLVLDDPPTPLMDQIRIILETPLRLKYQDHFTAELPFHLLIRAALRRIATLNQQFADGEPPLYYKGLVARAHEVDTVHSTIRWYDWKRYSFLQERTMMMGGMVGAVTYSGLLNEFIPLLRYVEKVHVGKGTTFGLGKIQMVI